MQLPVSLARSPVIPYTYSAALHGPCDRKKATSWYSHQRSSKDMAQWTTGYCHGFVCHSIHAFVAVALACLSISHLSRNQLRRTEPVRIEHAARNHGLEDTPFCHRCTQSSFSQSELDHGTEKGQPPRPFHCVLFLFKKKKAKPLSSSSFSKDVS